MQKLVIEFLQKFENRSIKIARVNSILITKFINLQLFTLILSGFGVYCDLWRFSVLSPFIEKSVVVHNSTLWGFHLAPDKHGFPGKLTIIIDTKKLGNWSRVVKSTQTELLILHHILFYNNSIQTTVHINITFLFI